MAYVSDGSGVFDNDFEHWYEYNEDEVEEESQDVSFSLPVKPLNVFGIVKTCVL